MKDHTTKTETTKFQALDKKQMCKIAGGETTPPKVINVVNTIVDDLNGLIR